MQNGPLPARFRAGVRRRRMPGGGTRPTDRSHRSSGGPGGGLPHCKELTETTMLTPSGCGSYQISHCEKFDEGGAVLRTVYRDGLYSGGPLALMRHFGEAAAAGALPTAALRLQSEGRVPAALPEESAARDAQQGDRDGRAPRSQGRLAATFF